MHSFFVDEGGFAGDEACLEAGDARHARQVLRLAPGTEVILLDGQRRYRGTLLQAAGETVRCRRLEALPSTEARLQLTLFQGLPKGEKMELIIQKMTELGAAEIVPVIMERCVARFSPGEGEKKLARWRKIAREAMKQSGRTAQLRIAPPLPLEKALEQFADFDLALAPWEEARGKGPAWARRTHPDARRVALAVGPEGGVSPREAQAMAAAGAQLITLGPRILRTETAGIAAAAALLALYGDMDGGEV